MEKIITEDPKGMVEHMHNFVFVKNGVVYVRLGKEEMSLVDYIRKMDKEIFNIEHDDRYCNAEDFAEYMDGDRFTCNMYLALVGFAEVRNYLKYYEEKTESNKLADYLIKNASEAFEHQERTLLEDIIKKYFE